MKIQFKFDEKKYDEIIIQFTNDDDESNPELIDLESSDRDNFKMVVVDPVVKTMISENPENTYGVDVTEDKKIKILCPAGDGEIILKKLYRVTYTLFKFLERGIVNEGVTNEQAEEIAQSVKEEVKKMSDEEIIKKLNLIKTDE